MPLFATHIPNKMILRKSSCFLTVVVKKKASLQKVVDGKSRPFWDTTLKRSGVTLVQKLGSGKWLGGPPNNPGPAAEKSRAPNWGRLQNTPIKKLDHLKRKWIIWTNHQFSKNISDMLVFQGGFTKIKKASPSTGWLGWLPVRFSITWKSKSIKMGSRTAAAGATKCPVTVAPGREKPWKAPKIGGGGFRWCSFSIGWF